MSDFEDIRPYSDNEVRAVLDRLVNEPELIKTILDFRFSSWPGLLRPILASATRFSLKRKVKRINSIRDLQLIIEKYMHHVIDTSTHGINVTGVENLSPDKPHLFISNHRDIVLDPAFINLSLHQNGIDTMRIAIGDNLLGKDWIADLMRLNKSFVVKRSVKTVRQKLLASKQLSKYVYVSMTEENANMWIAQREGRAKDGNDFTNSAVISMLLLNKPKPQVVEEYIHALRIVPVSISYEYDPCDVSKALELYERKASGQYEKQHNEDILSIASGIQGEKGRVNVHFDKVLSASEVFSFENAKAVASEIERSIIGHYVLMPTNIAAAMLVDNPLTESQLQEVKGTITNAEIEKAKAYLIARFAPYPEAVKQEGYSAYAAPVFNQIAVKNGEALAPFVELEGDI
ncbi:1-acyl-sn-glycerol-3-phosphate acyltransferase [Alteromonas sp. a30]|uniref:1-acyl-sn-glycerol-3-phosphate acyltransferase n=1 Tax=Alteromonas sp. a30 TaxID=2730917 RepID=UPI00227FA377|nr:1-acyl-sn-glycerol-3-phosphate acyltransferase [Alteromonas sp. a30]MCY7295353.1 cytochrome C oxidase Cbb3 [Alteromonas sp. a30]